MLQVAIVGVGWAGARHVEGIRELGEKIRVDCLVDNDPEHLEAQATELGVEKTYGDLSAALAAQVINGTGRGPGRDNANFDFLNKLFFDFFGLTTVWKIVSLN